jgi:ribosome recycling factor
MDALVQDTKKKIDKVLDILKSDLSTLRTGRATPSLVENIVITAYGGSTKLKVVELATVGASDSQTLQINPFDPSIIHDIQKGIEVANVGLNPIIDGNLIRITIPPLSQDRREELIKAMKHKLENGKIMVRQVRHEAMNMIKKEFDGREDDIKRLEKETQKLIDETMTTIDEWGKQKEAELLRI